MFAGNVEHCGKNYLFTIRLKGSTLEFLKINIFLYLVYLQVHACMVFLSGGCHGKSIKNVSQNLDFGER